MMVKWLFVAEFILGSLLIIVFFLTLGHPDYAPMWGTTVKNVQIVMSYTLYSWYALYFFSSIAVVVEVVGLVRQGDLATLRRSMIIVKAACIPFFVLNFALGLAIALGSMLVGSIIVIPLTYLFLLPTSAYGLGCLALLHKRRAVPTWLVTLNVILHLMFVLDLISTAVVFIISRTGRYQTGPKRPVGAPRTSPYGE